MTNPTRHVAKLFGALVCCIVIVGTGPATASAQGTLSVSFDTTEAGGNYAPENIVAAWIEDTNGVFVKTLGRWADRRIDHLIAWSAASGQDADAVSGATRSNHNTRLTVMWDLTDTAAMQVPDGDYVLRLELSDRNSSAADQNNQASFTITKDGQPSDVVVAGGGFENVSVSIAYNNPQDCGNGVVDSGETCDPVDSCPSSCVPAQDVCVSTALVGSADTCTAECVDSPITMCIDGDGCCASGCTVATDDDCTPADTDDGAADGQGPVTGACVASGRGGATTTGLLLLGAMLIAGRRRSRRR